jgi:hypothetical protein
MHTTKARVVSACLVFTLAALSGCDTAGDAEPAPSAAGPTVDNRIAEDATSEAQDQAIPFDRVPYIQELIATGKAPSFAEEERRALEGSILEKPEHEEKPDASTERSTPGTSVCAHRVSEVAYDGPSSRPSSISCEGQTYRYRGAYSSNVLAVYATSDNKRVIFGWRGSSDLGDWLRNLQSATLSARIDNPYCSGKPSVVVGSGWAARVWNTRFLVNDWLDDHLSQVDEILVTGHSLGGVSANLSGHFIAECFSQQGGSSAARTSVVAFNPPRMTYSAYASSTQHMRTVLSGANADVRALSFIRWGDIVHDLPAGYLHVYDVQNTSCVPSGNVMRGRRDSFRWSPHQLYHWPNRLPYLGC